MRIGYLHIGPTRGGIRRYGRIIAAEARRRPDLTVLEADVLLGNDDRRNHTVLAQAGRYLSSVDLVHLQYNKSVWNVGWRHFFYLRTFFAHCRCPIVVTAHDVYPSVRDLHPWGPPSGAWGVSPASLPRDPAGAARRLSVTMRSVARRIGARLGRYRSFETVALRWLGRRACVIHVNSHEERRRLCRLVSARKVKTVLHFVEERSIGATPAEARRALGLERATVISLLGFIVPRKGYELLLDALPFLPDDVTTVFAGGAPARGQRYVDRLTRLVEDRGLRDRVRITGYLSDDDLERYLVATDLAVCPFERLSASGSLSTWISVAKPILASDLPQMAEYNQLEPGAIRTFRPYTADALAKAIRESLDNRGEGHDPAVARLRDRLSIGTIFDEHLQYYRLALGGSTGRNDMPSQTGPGRGRKSHRALRVTFLPQWYRNPYQRNLGDHLSALGVRYLEFERSPLSIIKGLLAHRPDVLHLHWLHPFYEAPRIWQSVVKLTISLLGFIGLKLLGTKIVWTAHNLRHHEHGNPKLDRVWTRFVARHADAIIAHCETAKRLTVAEFDLPDPGKVFVIPHANYVGSYEDAIDGPAARRELDLPDSAVVLLFLGQVRPYKGVLELVDTFRQLDDPDAQLVIAGNSLNDDDPRLINERIGDAKNVMYKPGFVPDEHMQVYLKASDAVVFPYRDVLTSGAAVLAMSFSRACVAPRLGCISDLLDEQGAFLYDSDDPDGLFHALERAIARRDELPAMGAHNRRSIEPWDWARAARMTLDVYERIRPAGQ